MPITNDTVDIQFYTRILSDFTARTYRSFLCDYSHIKLFIVNVTVRRSSNRAFTARGDIHISFICFTFFSWDLFPFLLETEKKSMLLYTFSETGLVSSVAMPFIL